MHYSNKKFSLKIIFSLSFVLFFTSVKLIAQPLAANAGIDQTICSGANATIGGSPTATFGAGGYTYFWSPSTGLSSTTASNPTASPTTTTTYTLQVTDALLAVATDIVVITVNPLPTVGGTLSPTTCNGSTMSSTSFSSTPAGATFNWTNSAPSIGLAASGTGSVPSFTAVNPGTTPVVASISVTATLAGCTGPPMVYTITVNPSPTVNPTATPTGCNGSTISGITFFSTPGGATFNWTNSNPSIGLAASGTGNMPSFTGTNPGSTTIGGNVSVTATLAGCSGPAYVFSPTVKPTPVGTTVPTSQTVCSGVASNFVSNSTVAGTTYTWAAFGSGVTGHSAGSGSLIAQSVSTTGISTGGVTYTITPTAAGCVGTNMIVNLTVNPNPVATATTSPLTRCSGDTVSFSVSCPVPSTTYTWVSVATNTSGADASGTGSFVFDTLTTTTASPGTMTYIFTPTAAGCVGSQAFPFVNVNPMPDVTASPAVYPAICSGDAVAVGLSSSLIGTTINWTSSEFNTAGSALSGSNVILETLTADPLAGTTTYTITPTNSGCFGTPLTYAINVNPFIDPTITTVPYACYGDAPFNFVAATTGGTWSGVGITDSILGTFDPTPAGLGTYSITYTSPGPCFFSDVTSITVVAGDINGNVTYSGGPLNSGTNTAVLFNYSSTFATFDTVQTCTLDAFGNYNFSSVYPGDYLIEIYADTLVYPLAVPTYYASEYLWDTATVLTHNCVNSTADVFVIEGIVTSGPGMISGFVTEGAGFVRAPGDPIPGLDVKLGKNPGGSIVTNTQTTSPLGAYGFSNLPINAPGEFYTVYVDIPGLQRDSVWNITVTATNAVFTNINYEADSNSVYPFFPVVTSIVSAETDHSLTVYPNPTNTSSTVEYTLTNTSNVTLDVVDVLGKQLQSLVNTKQSAGNYKVNLAKLNAGIYFIKLNINNQTNTTRLVVTD